MVRVDDLILSLLCARLTLELERARTVFGEQQRLLLPYCLELVEAVEANTDDVGARIAIGALAAAAAKSAVVCSIERPIWACCLDCYHPRQRLVRAYLQRIKDAAKLESEELRFGDLAKMERALSGPSAEEIFGMAAVQKRTKSGEGHAVEADGGDEVL